MGELADRLSEKEENVLNVTVPEELREETTKEAPETISSRDQVVTSSVSTETVPDISQKSEPAHPDYKVMAVEKVGEVLSEHGEQSASPVTVDGVGNSKEEVADGTLQSVLQLSEVLQQIQHSVAEEPEIAYSRP